MCGTTGQLRAMHSMDLLKEVDQVVAMSGSTWSTAIFAFAKGFSVKDLLGKDTANSLNRLTLKKLKTPNGKILERAASDLTPFVAVAAQPIFAVPPHKLFEVALGGNFLCPFGLNGELPNGLCSNSNKNQVWTTSDKRLDSIKQRNPHLDLSDALVMNKNLKSLVVQSTLLAPVGYNPNGSRMVSTRFSADFSGSPYYADQQNVDFEPWNTSLSPLKDVVVGGGVVESFAFMSTLPPESPRRPRRPARRGLAEAELEDEGILSLQQAVGISSSILAMVGVSSPQFVIDSFIKPLASINNYTEEFLQDPYLFAPRRKYWPVARLAKGIDGDIGEKTYYVGDGFSIDSAGLLEAIRGGAECAVVLVNNGWPIEDKGTVDFCNVPEPILANPLLLLGTPLGLQQSIYDYFGIALPDTILRAGLDYSNNHVFETSEIFSLFCRAQELRDAGDATVVYRKYTTLENRHWGIQAGKKIKVVFVWTEKTVKWELQLPDKTQAAINSGAYDSPGTAGFPYLGTFSPKPDGSDFTAVLPEQGNLYASLTEWSLRQNQEKLQKCMGA